MKITDEKSKWKSCGFFRDKFGIDSKEFKHMRENGLPFRRSGMSYLYREKDLNDYYSGRIGKDIKRDSNMKITNDLNEVKVSVHIDRRLAFAFTPNQIEEILWGKLKEAEKALEIF